MTVFTLPEPERAARLLPQLAQLTEHRRAASPAYAGILSALGYAPGATYGALADLPWLPVRLFKTHAIKSIPDADVFKVLTSSGTTGDVSRIYLDKAAAAAQTRSLAATVQSVLGP